MFLMKNGKPYMSKWCFNHPQLETNYKGKKRDMTTWDFTPEYVAHMKRIVLVLDEIDGKRYMRCPKCRMLYELQNSA